MHFTSNHDVNSWDGPEYERLRPLARPFAVLTALLPGMPMLYSGQEAGLNRRLAFFDCAPIEWGNFPLQDFYSRLFQLKKNHPALRNGDPASQLQRLPCPAEVWQWRDLFSDEILALLADQPLSVPAHGWRELVAECAAG